MRGFLLLLLGGVGAAHVGAAHVGAAHVGPVAGEPKPLYPPKDYAVASLTYRSVVAQERLQAEGAVLTETKYHAEREKHLSESMRKLPSKEKYWRMQIEYRELLETAFSNSVQDMLMRMAVDKRTRGETLTISLLGWTSWNGKIEQAVKKVVESPLVGASVRILRFVTPNRGHFEESRRVPPSGVSEQDWLRTLSEEDKTSTRRGQLMKTFQRDNRNGLVADVEHSGRMKDDEGLLKSDVLISSRMLCVCWGAESGYTCGGFPQAGKGAKEAGEKLDGLMAPGGVQLHYHFGDCGLQGMFPGPRVKRLDLGAFGTVHVVAPVRTTIDDAMRAPANDEGVQQPGFPTQDEIIRRGFSDAAVAAATRAMEAHSKEVLRRGHKDVNAAFWDALAQDFEKAQTLGLLHSGENDRAQQLPTGGWKEGGEGNPQATAASKSYGVDRPCTGRERGGFLGNQPCPCCAPSSASSSGSATGFPSGEGQKRAAAPAAPAARQVGAGEDAESAKKARQMAADAAVARQLDQQLRAEWEREARETREREAREREAREARAQREREERDRQMSADEEYAKRLGEEEARLSADEKYAKWLGEEEARLSADEKYAERLHKRLNGF